MLIMLVFGLSVVVQRLKASGCLCVQLFICNTESDESITYGGYLQPDWSKENIHCHCNAASVQS